ncbi:protein ASYMMETRIC LEAVES 2-like [Macadamia integrifolia]|uniref:protein ASYMMETRIC LEAVES 2-like n=1 Tax=Macadamia integrifolia TaxID=60698 RepID=UPI001C50192D|nr:protein ASYMMETRIC LEAVES 2-like [Macadamia integrifolia]
MASSSNSSCDTCKFLPRKCIQEYMFVDQLTKFANVHKVFTASNVAKILNELNLTQREDVVNSPAYKANARLHDLVYGCVGLISIPQQRLRQILVYAIEGFVLGVGIHSHTNVLLGDEISIESIHETIPTGSSS